MKVEKFVTNGPEQTIELAKEFARKIKLPAVFALMGQLGAGKTQFIKGLGEGLGIDKSKICSASFIIAAEYPIDGKKLIHIDAYRVKSPTELIDLGWDDMLREENVLIAIEWADKIEEILPRRYIRVEFKIIGEFEREITVYYYN